MSATPATDRRPRVLSLALTAGSGYGGAEKLAYEFAHRLDPARFASYLCTIRAEHPTRRESHTRDAAVLAARGVRAVNLGQPGPALLTPRGWWRLYSLLARESIDIVHAHMPRASAPGGVLARLARVPVVVSHEHGSTLEGKRLRPLLDREVVARLSTVMIAVSDYDRENLITRERIPPQRIRVLHNGIPRLEEPPEDAPPVLDRSAARWLIGAVGRLYAQKDYGTLIRAMALLRDRGYPVRCLIIGDGPQERELQALIEQLQLGQHVELAGRREDIPRVICELDVAVLSSIWEGSPLAALEYMAAGTPIVSTAVGGVPEMIRDGVEGLLVPPSDPKALAAAIARLLDDRNLAARLGAAAQSRQRDAYDLDGLVRRLEDLYLELLAGAGRA